MRFNRNQLCLFLILQLHQIYYEKKLKVKFIKRQQIFLQTKLTIFIDLFLRASNFIKFILLKTNHQLYIYLSQNQQFYNSIIANLEIIKIKKMEKALDLPRLKTMIKNGIASIPKDPSADQAVIVIGDTGVGKSTFLAFLSGQDLYVRYDGLKPVLDCPHNKNIKIGHQKYSQTSVPNKVVIENLAFYDCPGFRDNKGQQYEISNSFFVQRLLDIYPKVKIVLMIDQSHISQARADKLPRLTKNLLKSFKTFEDIKQGVVMIINRAQRDLNVTDYHRQIKKMCQLKNERGPLFQPEEQKFLKFLVMNNRILLFKQPRKEDKNQKFVPSENENSILRTIKYCNFVKSKHILNILSESAKLAIRDFIDDITSKSNVKIEAICGEIISNYSLKVSKTGKDVQGLLNLKQQIINLAEQIKSAQKEQIVGILQRQVSKEHTQDFSEDFAAVMFFKGIYDKTSTYFSNLVNKIYTELSHLLVKMDHRILKVQKDEQIEVERKRQVEKKRQIQQKRQKDKQNTMSELKKMEQLKSDVHQVAETNQGLLHSLGSTLEYLQNLKSSFKQMRKETEGLKQMSQNMCKDLENIQNRYLRSIDY